MNALWLLPLAMILWRFQGGAWFAAKLPGRPVWYVIPILALAAWAVHGGWQAPAVTTAGLLAVSLVPHGRWYTLGHLDRDLAGAPGLFERWIERLGDSAWRDDDFCLFAAKSIAFAPLILMAIAMLWPYAFFAAAFAPAIILQGYRVGWRLHSQGFTAVPTSFGEYAAGLAIGLIILGMGA